MQDFKKLDVYLEAKSLALEMYRLTSKFPQGEIFNMTSQLRRAALSVGANIAEGAGRFSNKDFTRFLFNSMGSLKEIEHFLLVAMELNYITQKEFDTINERRERIAKMLTSLMYKLH